MGYTTDFEGMFEIDKPVDETFEKFINDFATVRHMVRDPEKVKELYPDWENRCFNGNGNLGVECEFFIPNTINFGQNHDETIIHYNYPPKTQPGLWCQWIIEDNALVWDGNEKFYNYIEWLEYLIKNFFEPCGYKLNGTVEWYGEERSDFGQICVENNNVTVKYGTIVYE